MQFYRLFKLKIQTKPQKFALCGNKLKKLAIF